MKRYVVGFMTDQDGENVVLIKKQTPAWQKGRLNGVGGNIEAGETSFEAMAREFREETGVDTAPDDWKLIARLFNDEYECFFFHVVGEPYDAQTTEDEEIIQYWTENLQVPTKNWPVIDNLRWLIPLCFDKFVVFPLEVRTT
jgi:8-oxo-dGTP diphosphatase